MQNVMWFLKAQAMLSGSCNSPRNHHSWQLGKCMYRGNRSTCRQMIGSEDRQYWSSIPNLRERFFFRGCSKIDFSHCKGIKILKCTKFWDCHTLALKPNKYLFIRFYYFLCIQLCRSVDQSISENQQDMSLMHLRTNTRSPPNHTRTFVLCRSCKIRPPDHTLVI